jgi:hypothetical protein
MLYVTLVEKSIFRFLTHTFQGPRYVANRITLHLLQSLKDRQLISWSI